MPAVSAKEFRVKGKFRIKDVDSSRSRPFKDKESAQEALKELTGRLAQLQDVFYADNRHSLLICLQAMDTGGKDGLIKCVMDSFDPLGCNVINFRSPSAVELDHDYLWRHYRNVPARGEIMIHNRSHYENVLVVRVHELAPEKEWRRRYEQINRWERLMTDLGTTIVKIYLHISNEEQKERLQSRLDDPRKLWKFSMGDLAERKHWDRYMEAYEDALRECSTPHAPWYAIPADKKWFRNIAVAQVLIETLEGMKLRYPEPTVKNPRKVKIV